MGASMGRDETPEWATQRGIGPFVLLRLQRSRACSQSSQYLIVVRPFLPATTLTHRYRRLLASRYAWRDKLGTYSRGTLLFIAFQTVRLMNLEETIEYFLALAF
jgi:hypothetical protein